LKDPDEKIIVSADDPARCNAHYARSSDGQCFFKAVEGTNYCPMHNGSFQANENKKKHLYEIKRTEYHIRVQKGIEKFSNNYHDISEEIGIMRLMVEEILNQLEGSNDFIMMAPQINQTIMNIGSLIDKSLKLEERMKNLLSREKVIQIGQALMNAVAENIDDPDLLCAIAESFSQVLENNLSPADNLSVNNQG